MRWEILSIKEGRKLVCWYKAPCGLYDHPKIYVDEHVEKNYELRWNDDRLNLHNCESFMICRDNIYLQPILLKHVATNYKEKYVTKFEKGS